MFNYPENLFHESRQIRRFEGDRFFLNSPTQITMVNSVISVLLKESDLTSDIKSQILEL
jgi:hypothetical protein